MKSFRQEAGVAATMALVLSSIVEVAFGGAPSRKAEAPRTVVFVCEHGNVKSLIAREWFNRLAAERGLDVVVFRVE